jgi:hypothetical protein
MLFFIQDWNAASSSQTGLTFSRDEMWVVGKWLIFGSGNSAAAFFARKQMEEEEEQTGLRTPTTGRLPTI